LDPIEVASEGGKKLSLFFIYVVFLISFLLNLDGISALEYSNCGNYIAAGYRSGQMLIYKDRNIDPKQEVS
jgi:hypothetical protein